MATKAQRQEAFRRLALAAGKHVSSSLLAGMPAPRRRSKPKDGGLVPMILNWCATRPDELWAWRANSGMPRVVNRDGSIGRFKSGEAGTPDILAVALGRTRSVFFGIEAKRRSVNKKRRESQIRWHAKAEKFRVPVVTVDNFSDARTFILGLLKG